jgi:EpsI family protein
MFPSEFGEWQIDNSTAVVLPAPDVQAKLDAIYNQVLARTYVSRVDGQRIMLSVAYGGDQSDGMNAHLPEVCYPAQGFQLMGARSVVLELDGHEVPARRLQTQLGSRVEPVTYWLTLGESVAASRTQRKLQQIRYGLRGFIPDGMLVRVSSINRDVPAGFAAQDRFLKALAQAIPVAYRSRILGAA